MIILDFHTLDRDTSKYNHLSASGFEVTSHLHISSSCTFFAPPAKTINILDGMIYSYSITKRK